MRKRLFFLMLIFIFTFSFFFSEGMGPEYIFNSILKKRFSKKVGVLKVYKYKFLFSSKYGNFVKEWYFDTVNYVEWNGKNEIKIHFNKKDVKFFFKKKKIKFIIISPELSEKMIDNINNMILKFKEKKLNLDVGDVEKKLPIILEAKHIHLIGECFGKLKITTDGIEYKSIDGEHHFSFFYSDIKDVKRDTPSDLKVIIFNRKAKKMWKNDTFSFKLLKGENLSDDIFLYIRYRIGRED